MSAHFRLPDRGTYQISTGNSKERRGSSDRRERALHGLWMGHWFRRRRLLRRAGEAHPASMDWHDAHWLGAATLVVLLSIADAFLTLTLLRHGAAEVNPLMAPLVVGDGRAFAYWKFGLTSVGVITLVVLARVRLFGLIPVGVLVYVVLAGYVCLVTYEVQLLHRVGTDVVSYWQFDPLNYAT
jgi:hypothetical protein